MTLRRLTYEAQAGRIGPLATLPVFLVLDGKRAVLAGESAAAAWKAELLCAAGARVDVYAVDISEELQTLAADLPRGAITLRQEGFAAEDFTGAAVAVGAFEDETRAADFAQMARAAGVPVNVVDRPTLSDFTFGAIVNRSPLVIGISTDGAAPVFAQAIRAKLEALLPRGLAAWLVAAQSWRAVLRTSGLSHAARRTFWRLFARRAVDEAQRAPAQEDFDSLVAAVKEEGAAIDNGSVTVFGVGSGDAELLTLRAVRALQSADVIFYDDGVSNEVLDFARREAKKLLVATSHGDEATALAARLARRGKRVVRLTSSDPSAVGGKNQLPRLQDAL